MDRAPSALFLAAVQQGMSVTVNVTVPSRGHASVTVIIPSNWNILVAVQGCYNYSCHSKKLIQRLCACRVLVGQRTWVAMPLGVATAIALQECTSMQLPSGQISSRNLSATVANTFSASAVVIIQLLFMLLLNQRSLLP